MNGLFNHDPIPSQALLPNKDGVETRHAKILLIYDKGLWYSPDYQTAIAGGENHSRFENSYSGGSNPLKAI